MVKDFNEGRSKSYYCVAAAVLEPEELQEALTCAKQKSGGLTMKDRSKILHAIIDTIAAKKKYNLTLRK